jgi:glycosyltransferase involved in cell wall biosynthesis
MAENKIIRFSTTGPKKLGCSLEMERTAAGIEGQRINIVHQHGIWMGVSRVTNIFRQKKRVPSVIAPHGSLERWALNRSRWKKKAALAYYERSNLFEASCLHATAPQEVEGFREFGLRNPVAIIRNGVAGSWLSSDGCAETFHTKFNVRPDKRIAFFMSRITPVKGLPLLLEAIHVTRRYFRDWVLVVAGPDEFNHLAQVRTIIHDLKLDDVVQYIGPLSNQDKRDAFAAADLFILPTRREAAPVVVLEALGAGVPVLTTIGAPWQDLVTHNCGWWVDVDSNAIAAAIRDAVNRSPEELRQMGRRGRDLVASMYTWNLLAQKTIRLYAWLLGREDKPEFVVLD